LHYNDIYKGDRAILIIFTLQSPQRLFFEWRVCNDKVEYLKYEELFTDGKCLLRRGKSAIPGRKKGRHQQALRNPKPVTAKVQRK
jgi:hypothetical protein